MSIDLKRTFYTWSDTQSIAAGALVTEEGSGLVRVLEDGVEKVKPSAGAGGEVVVGFAIFRQKTYGTDALVDTGVIPLAAPFEIQLEQNNLISSQLRVVDSAGTAFTVVLVAPAAGEVQVDYASGKLTFNTADQGKTITATYRYNLTVAEAVAKFHSDTPNHPDANLFSMVGVGKGKGRVFTNYYDAAQNYGAAAPALTLGAGGVITVGGAGPAIPGARVVQVPSASDPFLGIEFLV